MNLTYIAFNIKVKGILLLLICVFAVGVLCCSCDKCDGQKPSDYPKTRWVCKEYDVWFAVAEKNGMYFGECTVGGETQQIAISFMNAHELQILPRSAIDHPVGGGIDESEKLWQGEANFSKRAMTVYQTSYNRLFEGIEKDTEIKFVRYDASLEEIEALLAGEKEIAAVVKQAEETEMKK